MMLDLRNILDPDDVKCVRNVAERLSEGEELTVIVENEHAPETDPVCGILDEYGFDYQPKSAHDGSYCINAKKRRPIH